MPSTVLCLSMLATPFAPAQPWPAVWEVWDGAVEDHPVGRVWIEQLGEGADRRCVERWALATSKKAPASLLDRKLELKPTRDERPVDLAAFVERARLRLQADELARFDRTVTAIVDGACDAVPAEAACTWGAPPVLAGKAPPQTWAPGTTRVRYGEQVYGLLWKAPEGAGFVERWVFDDPTGLTRAKLDHTWMATGSAADAEGFRSCACRELAENNVPGVPRAYEVHEVVAP